jgi:hypothetical protein
MHTKKGARSVARIVGAAVAAAALGACELIEDLRDYSSCADNCDASIAVVDAAPAGAEQADSGPEAGSSGEEDASPDVSDGSIPCPDGGCPTSMASGYSACSFGSCNGSTGSACPTGGGCFCIKDSQCSSGKCVKVTGENDVSCASDSCTGTGSVDGVDCELASPGIPVPTGVMAYTCPADAGYLGTNLTCEASQTNCYCTADGECPSGHCVSDVANNNGCSNAGPCTGTGTPDYRGCQAASAPDGGCGYPQTCSGECSGGIFSFGATCVCNSDDQCVSGKCTTSCGSNCTGSGAAQANGCVAPPDSVPCVAVGGGTGCHTTLSPVPVLNLPKTACLCVADSNCASGKCVNIGLCTGTCTGTGAADSQGCAIATSVPIGISCPIGNCDTVSSPDGGCVALGTPCWCTSDSQCPSGSSCAPWSGCAPGACGGSTSATPNGFHCVP